MRRDHTPEAKIVNYFNRDLKGELQFRETYHIKVNLENNRYELRLLSSYRIEKNFSSVILNNRAYYPLIKNQLLEYVDDIHVKAVGLKLIYDTKEYIGVDLHLYRDESLENELKILPEEIILQILLLSDYSTVKSFTETCKGYDKMCDNLFWFNRLSNSKRVNYFMGTSYKNGINKTVLIEKEIEETLMIKYNSEYNYKLIYDKYCNQGNYSRSLNPIGSQGAVGITTAIKDMDRLIKCKSYMEFSIENKLYTLDFNLLETLAHSLPEIEWYRLAEIICKYYTIEDIKDRMLLDFIFGVTGESADLKVFQFFKRKIINN